MQSSKPLGPPLNEAERKLATQNAPTTTDGKISLRGKLGALLTVIWLVRVQVGAKMGKLTLLGGVRGTNLELKGALRGSKSVLRASKSVPRASKSA